MGRHLFSFQEFLEIALFFEFLTICMNVPASYGQPGFLSIDCGISQDNYIDDIGLSWVNDRPYISTGTNSVRAFNISSLSDWSYDFNYSRMGALRDFRYFPEHRSKYCYDLPTNPDMSYLIRPMFYYTASESNVLQLPIEFNVFINSTNWFTVNSSTYSVILEEHEGIFYSPGSAIHFCLQPVTGVPFISSLELRPLDPEGIMYSYSGSKREYLSLWERFNFGAQDVVRFPDDQFDRIWSKDWRYSDLAINNTSPRQLNTNTSAKVNNVPAKVMLDGVQLDEIWSIASSQMDFPVDYVYIVVYFQNLNESQSQGGMINMSITDGKNLLYTSLPFKVTSNISMQGVPKLALAKREVDIYFNYMSNLANLTINAAEIYIQNAFHNIITRQFEEEAIRLMKTSFNLTGWEGDPCGPVPFDGITCSYFETDWSIKTIMISNLSSIGWPLFIDKYNAIYQKLDDSYMLLLGISFPHSHIDDDTFQFLLENFSSFGGSLDLSYNKISTAPPTMYNGDGYIYFGSLNLAHNALGGELSWFGDMVLSTGVDILNLSYNNITSLRLPNDWESNQTTYLQTLDLSHNNLGDGISSLNRMMMRNWETLEQLNISYNKLTGSFPSEVYFSNLTYLLTGNFDGNQIGGTLDLSLWHESLQQLMNTSKLPIIDQFYTSKVSVIDQLFSFVNNNIKDINPSIEILQVTIATLLKNNPNFTKAGILLGGNPYCKATKSEIHWHLCRYTINDTYKVQDKKEHKVFIIIGIIGGFLVLLVCCALLGIVWYLRNKVSTLRQIQTVLANQKVQPPFYPYNDLKYATRNFHKDNKLGNGAFGVVYKGVLEDGTTLAVKKLFNAQQVQVLNEFLNEVVLITGIKHKNLVQLKGCSINDKQRILVYEYVENGNLAEALWDKQASEMITLDWQQRFKICVGIARGLSYLHEELQPRIIHRDIKPANILLDNNFNPKIGDFGLAKHYLNEQSQAQFTSVAGTRGYFAPEYASQGKLTDKADVFSFGILVLEIVSGRKVIDPSLPPEKIYLKDWAQQLHQDGALLELLQPELRKKCLEVEVIRVINIALVCVQMHPERRATMSQVVTMLLGNMDVTLFLDKQSYYQPNFSNILPSADGHIATSISTLHNNCKVIIEEFDESPLLQDKEEITLPFNSNIGSSSGSSSIARVELSDMTGR